MKPTTGRGFFFFFRARMAEETEGGQCEREREKTRCEDERRQEASGRAREMMYIFELDPWRVEGERVGRRVGARGVVRCFFWCVLVDERQPEWYSREMLADRAAYLYERTMMTRRKKRRMSTIKREDTSSPWSNK